MKTKPQYEIESKTALMVGRLLQNEPTAEVLAGLENLVDSKTLDEMLSSEFACSEQFRDGLFAFSQAVSQLNDIESTVAKIKHDYLYLFFGIGKALASPWGSVYSSDDRLLFQEETLDVRRWYRRFGMKVDSTRFGPEDQIGTEIEFIGMLLGGEGGAGPSDEKVAAARDFAARHPARWVGSWNGCVQEHAETQYLRGLAMMAFGIVMSLIDIDEAQRAAC